MPARLGRLLSRVTTAPAAEVLSSPRVARKLTAADVRCIRNAYDLGVSQDGLARQYNVTPTAIYHIVTGRTWKKVA